MIAVPTSLAGAVVIEPEPMADTRGFFCRLYCAETFKALGLDPAISQISMSHNARAGIVRGLHIQRPPSAETKLVRVTRGAIFDVIVDVRAGSPTYGAWSGTELSEHNRRQLYIPAGMAHGFQTLEPETDVTYVISAPFAPGHQDGLLWNDPDIAIAWPSPETAFLSERDRQLLPLKSFAPVSMPC